MDAAMDVDLVPSNKPCQTCRMNLIPIFHSHFKNCDDCRAKNRMKEAGRVARRVARRQEADRLIEAYKKRPMKGVSANDRTLIPNAIISNDDTSSTPLAGMVKPKSGQKKLLHELKGKEKELVIEEMKASLQKTILIKNSSSVPAEAGGATEFQSASFLYEKLKRKALRYASAGKRLRFHGCHSIVAEAAINHRDRVLMVANDIRKFSRISFDNSAVMKTSKNIVCSATLSCRCLSMGKNQTGTSAQAQSLVECGGTVRVTAELDSSHPGGLVGQRISVYIHH